MFDRSPSRHRLTCAVALAGVAITSAAALAVPRKVLFEDFNATWCGPCVPAGEALGMLIEDFPDRVVAFQAHVSDSYTTPWTNARASSYGVSGIPHIQVDGVLNQVGSWSNPLTNYNNFVSLMGQRPATTDVMLEISAIKFDLFNHKAFVRVGLEAGGAPKTVRVQLVQVRNNYPSGDHYVHTVIDDIIDETITLADDGTMTEIAQEFEVATIHAGFLSQTRLIAFVQAVTSPRQIHQAEMMAYSEYQDDCNGNGLGDLDEIGDGTALDCNENNTPDACDISSGSSTDANGNGVPDECEEGDCPADLSGDSTVNADDLFSLLGSWGSCAGCPADLTGDDNVNADDLFQLLGAWGDC